MLLYRLTGLPHDFMKGGKYERLDLKGQDMRELDMTDTVLVDCIIDAGTTFPDSFDQKNLRTPVYFETEVKPPQP